MRCVRFCLLANISHTYHTHSHKRDIIVLVTQFIHRTFAVRVTTATTTTTTARPIQLNTHSHVHTSIYSIVLCTDCIIYANIHQSHHTLTRTAPHAFIPANTMESHVAHKSVRTHSPEWMRAAIAVDLQWLLYGYCRKNTTRRRRQHAMSSHTLWMDAHANTNSNGIA